MNPQIDIHDPALPLVSVAIPTYNYGQYIGQAVQSALNQTYPHLEVVIRDDCSPPPDDTEQVVRSYNDPRIKFSRNDRNVGLFANLNATLRECHGDFIKILCGDDRLRSTCIEHMVRALQGHPEAGHVFSNYVSIDSDGHLRSLVRLRLGGRTSEGRELYFNKQEAQRIFYFEGCRWGNLSTGMLRKDAIDATGAFNETLSHVGDFEFLIRLSNRYGMVYIPTPLAEVRTHQNSASSRNFASGATFAEFYTLMKRFPCISQSFSPGSVGSFWMAGKIDETLLWYALSNLIHRRVGSAAVILGQVRKNGSLPRALAFLIVRSPMRLKRIACAAFRHARGLPQVYTGQL
jgi:glycosyltransferase involved in cell wall biosynthesis